jgi:hypothetical protein
MLSPFVGLVTQQSPADGLFVSGDDMNKNDQLGEEIKALAAQRETDNAARKASTAALREKVRIVRDGYTNRQIFNGHASWTEWCNWACPNEKTKDPTRWFQVLLKEPKETEPNAVRVVSLENATHIKIGSTKYEISKVKFETFDDEGFGVVGIRVKIEQPKVKRLNADETRWALNQLKKIVGKDDKTSAWERRFVEVLEKTIPNRPEWVKVTTQKFLEEHKGYAAARERVEQDRAGWTKVERKSKWVHTDGRYITKSGSYYNTWNADGTGLCWNETSLDGAMGWTKERKGALKQQERAKHPGQDRCDACYEWVPEEKLTECGGRMRCTDCVRIYEHDMEQDKQTQAWTKTANRTWAHPDGWKIVREGRSYALYHPDGRLDVYSKNFFSAQTTANARVEESKTRLHPTAQDLKETLDDMEPTPESMAQERVCPPTPIDAVEDGL